MNKGKVQFINEKVKNAFENLTDEDLKKFLERAFYDIENNPFLWDSNSKKANF